MGVMWNAFTFYVLNIDKVYYISVQKNKEFGNESVNSNDNI